MKKKVARKSYMTLLETLIAFSILAVLLVFVFGFFRELSMITTMTEKGQKESFQMRYLESRLGFIFERIPSDKEGVKDRKFYFYMEPANGKFSSFPSLVFTFDNGARRDPTFSGDLLGRIYVDRQHRLCLATWPLYLKDIHSYLHKEILFSDVVSIKYEFYAPPPRTDNASDIVPDKETSDPEKKAPKPGIWQPEWLISYHEMPAMIKITLGVANNGEEQKEKGHDTLRSGTREIHLVFVLPTSTHPVYYPPPQKNEGAVP